jgi:hypothetical protein
VLGKIAAGGEDDQNGPGDGYPNKYVGRLSVVIGRLHGGSRKRFAQIARAILRAS